MTQKFFVCKHCGNMVGMIHSSGVPMICCGEKMT
ncbi:MAG: desulfoferrodoxin, partial [Clostridium sp.]